jgi:DNA-binding MarR family transcriptional regulator
MTDTRSNGRELGKPAARPKVAQMRGLRRTVVRPVMVGPNEDIADYSLVVWKRERPDIDSSAKRITGRILRLSEVFLNRFNAELAELGLTYSVYAILATLRTIGAPSYRMSPTQLKNTLMVTSGGLSNLLKKAEDYGYIRRTNDPDDRRGVVVELTRAGLTLCDRAMPLQAAAEQDLIRMLSAEQKDTVTDLLRQMMTKGP